MKLLKWTLFIITTLILIGCETNDQQLNNQKAYQDIPYVQDYSVKYYFENDEHKTKKVYTDRNEVIQVLTDDGLYIPVNGHLQYPGSLKKDKRYMPMTDKKVTDFVIYDNQFIYVDEKAVFSNAWAGKLYSKHNLPNVKMVCGSKGFGFLLSDGNTLSYVNDSIQLWQGQLDDDKILSIKYKKKSGQFFILGKKSLYSFSEKDHKLSRIFIGNNLTAFEITKNENTIILGTNNGYLIIDFKGKLLKGINNKLPWAEITSLKEINGQLWFGSTEGAFMLREDDKFNYYYGKRWLPSNKVKHIELGPENSVLILTDKGLGQICFKEMTLEEKAMKFEKDVRQRKIRYGMSTDKSSLEKYDLSTAQNGPADSDNLWTSMYLGSQLFRYLATGSEVAKQNCYEAFEVLERFHQINNIKGLFGRSIERRGYMKFGKSYRDYVEDYWYDGYQGTVAWHHADNEEWDWKAHASSDQTVGQIFSMALIAEYMDDDEWKKRAISILDDLMTYIVENDMYLIDTNGKPTLWGRWNPEYVNRFPTMVGDRRICSSNIISFLQAAYKFTGKELFKNKAFELMNEYGYLENLTRPIREIGQAPEGADGWSKMLSEEWNHSDDEMYFLAYWQLFPYSLNDSLKEQFGSAIKDHWEAVRPEKNPLWNFCYAMTGASEYDLDESIWTLKEWPLDMIEFEVKNSHRKDLEFLEPNFWGHTTAEVLPPDERPEIKHNRNVFKLDTGERHSELSAGDTFLLPYWMGRYLGVISAPENK
jgi:hypothetical protein